MVIELYVSRSTREKRVDYYRPICRCDPKSHRDLSAKQVYAGAIPVNDSRAEQVVGSSPISAIALWAVPEMILVTNLCKCFGTRY